MKMRLDPFVACLFLALFCHAANAISVVKGNLVATISPQDAKVGDTVTVTCSYTTLENSYLITVRKTSDGVSKDVGTNDYINYKFKKTGRYTAATQTNDKGGTKEFVVTISITDAQIEDSGEMECFVPAENLSESQELQVTEESETPAETPSTPVNMMMSVVGIESSTSPEDASVGDTVAVTCTLTAPDLSGLGIRVIKNTNGDVKEVSFNKFINQEFKDTGRYSSALTARKQDGMYEVILTITISDVQTEDAGRFGCAVPTEDLLNYSHLNVS